MSAGFGRWSRASEIAFDAWLDGQTTPSGLDPRLTAVAREVRETMRAEHARHADTQAIDAGWEQVLANHRQPASGQVATESAPPRSPRPSTRPNAGSERRTGIPGQSGRPTMTWAMRATTMALVLVLIAASLPLLREWRDDPARLSFQATPETTTGQSSRHPDIPSWCDVTLPNGYPDSMGIFPGVSDFYGEPGLYAPIPPDGVYSALMEPGSELAWNKWIWVREEPGGRLSMQLTFNGARTNDVHPDASIPDGYGDTGVQVTGPAFPEEGCWTVTVWTPNVSVEVTLWVVFIDDWLATPDVPASATHVAEAEATPSGIQPYGPAVPVLAKDDDLPMFPEFHAVDPDLCVTVPPRNKSDVVALVESGSGATPPASLPDLQGEWSIDADSYAAMEGVFDTWLSCGMYGTWLQQASLQTDRMVVRDLETGIQSERGPIPATSTSQKIDAREEFYGTGHKAVGGRYSFITANGTQSVALDSHGMVVSEDGTRVTVQVVIVEAGGTIVWNQAAWYVTFQLVDGRWLIDGIAENSNMP